MELVDWLQEPPALERPVLLVALEGFVDAGAAASTAAMFLRHRWKADVVARFDRESLLDYRARRPTVDVDDGRLRRLEWPQLELCAAQVEGPRDALLLLGPEPDMRWEAFAQACAGICDQLGVEIVVGLGAYPAASPHTRPVRITRAGNELAGDLVPEAAPVSGYSGPIGAATALQVTLAEHGIPALGLWAEVPHYISGSPNPAAALALVRLLAATLSTDVDTTELEAAAKLHRGQVDEAIADHPDAADLVVALERHVDSGGEGDELPSGEDLAAEIERFLRTQREG